MRSSLTRGRRTGTAPAAVATSRASWNPLRPPVACRPRRPRAGAPRRTQRPRLATPRPLGGAPSRAISSAPTRRPPPGRERWAGPSRTTLNMDAPSEPTPRSPVPISELWIHTSSGRRVRSRHPAESHPQVLPIAQSTAKASPTCAARACIPVDLRAAPGAMSACAPGQEPRREGRAAQCGAGRDRLSWWRRELADCERRLAYHRVRVGDHGKSTRALGADLRERGDRTARTAAQEALRGTGPLELTGSGVSTVASGGQSFQSGLSTRHRHPGDHPAAQAGIGAGQGSRRTSWSCLANLVLEASDSEEFVYQAPLQHHLRILVLE